MKCSIIVYYAFIVGFIYSNIQAAAEVVQQDVLQPYKGPSIKGVDTTTLAGKVMCGYQGWFNCEGDGAGLGWTHWARNRNKPFNPGNVTVDLWPDLTEYDEDELYETGFKFADGKVAKTFSSHHRKTVLRHFEWMREHGIDGAFVQRFSNELYSKRHKHHKDVVLSSAREGANRLGRAYAVMYDITGTPSETVVQVLRNDWKVLRSEMKITDDPAYLKHKGKPLVAIWGIGFSGSIKGRALVDQCSELIDIFKEDGCTVMLGTPTAWLSQTRDASDDPKLHEVLKKADIISPWSVGRFVDIEGVKHHAKHYLGPDIEWCQKNQMDYLPVVFPGFSRYNLKNEEVDFNSIPRLKGKFLWSQVYHAKKAGAEMIYVAMFDEVDEGTAIFKCTNNPPRGNGGRFIDYEGLPSDFYLRLTGKIGELLRGEIALTEDIPMIINSDQEADSSKK